MPFIHFRYPSKANLAPKYRTFGNLSRLDHCLTTCNIGIWSPQGERGMGESVAQGKDELEVNVNQRIFHNTCAPFHLLFPYSIFCLPILGAGPRKWRIPCVDTTTEPLNTQLTTPKRQDPWGGFSLPSRLPNQLHFQRVDDGQMKMRHQPSPLPQSSPD